MTSNAIAEIAAAPRSRSLFEVRPASMFRVMDHPIVWEVLILPSVKYGSDFPERKHGTRRYLVWMEEAGTPCPHVLQGVIHSVGRSWTILVLVTRANIRLGSLIGVCSSPSAVMKMERSLYQQLAIGAIIALIAGAVFAIDVALTVGIGTIPGYGMYITAAFLMIGLLFLPLVWWGHGVGYIGGIFVGFLTLIGCGLGLFYVSVGDLTGDSIGLIIIALVIAVVLIYSSFSAWRERA